MFKYNKIDEPKQTSSEKRDVKSYGTVMETSTLEPNAPDTVFNFLQRSPAFADIVKLNEETGHLNSTIRRMETFDSFFDLSTYLESNQPRAPISAMNKAKQMLPSYFKPAPTADTLLSALASEVTAEMKRLGMATLERKKPVIAY